jgi:hypothetical protein
MKKNILVVLFAMILAVSFSFVGCDKAPKAPEDKKVEDKKADDKKADDKKVDAKDAAKAPEKK